MDDIFTQCREGNAVAVRLWLDNTENDLNQGDDHGFSPLHWACREGRSSVVDMLIMRGARINVMNRGDDTPLHLASSHGHRDIVGKLIQCKADVNTANEHGNTPLHYACFWGQDPVAEDLVTNGAQVNICNKYGETPLDKAKPHLREALQEKAEKLGQSLTKVPFKDTFWKGTTRTRPRNGTLNKAAGIDFKQLSLLAKINENQSGELWQGRWQGNEVVEQHFFSLSPTPAPLPASSALSVERPSFVPTPISGPVTPNTHTPPGGNSSLLGQHSAFPLPLGPVWL